MTGQSHYITLVLPTDRTVLTIHDLRFVHDRTGLRGWVLRKLLLDLPIRKLKYITAISEATRDEIVEYTRCDPSLIRVIENPIRDEFLQKQDIREFYKSRPTILQIGITENKNIPRLVEALQGIPCRLVIVGRISETIREMCQRFGVEIENLQDLTDSEIVEQYRDADIVSFCSTYEGFGMPIIEAQALGKPVITSDLSPMKEVAGGAAIMVDPFNVEQIRNGILSLINNGDLREQLVKLGLENVKRFEAANIARQYEALYEEIYEANSRG